MKYTDSYRESVTLRDGASLEIRAVQPSDKALLADGFERLSPQSRRRRFFTSKAGLSAEELRYLTEFDGRNHFAIGAMSAPADGGQPEGVGVARFIRSETEEDTAEISVVVVDAWQRRGIGGLLLERIVAAAAERRIGHIRAVALTENPQIVDLLEKDRKQVTVRDLEPGVIEIRFPVADPVATEVLEALLSTFRMVAKGAFVIPIWFGQKTVRHLLALGGKQED